MTTFAEVKQAVNEQIAAVKAGSREDKREVLSRLRRMKRDLIGGDESPEDKVKRLTDDWKDMRDMQSDEAFYDQGLFSAAGTSVIQELGSLPETSEETGVLTQKKVERLLKKVADVTATAHATEATRKQCQDWLARFFDVKVKIAEDSPDLDNDLETLSAAEVLDSEELYAVFRKVTTLGQKLRPEPSE